MKEEQMVLRFRVSSPGPGSTPGEIGDGDAGQAHGVRRHARQRHHIRRHLRPYFRLQAARQTGSMVAIFYHNKCASHDAIIESACLWLEDVTPIR